MEKWSAFNLIPTALDVPAIEAFYVEDAGYTGPFGAKGLGEPAMLPRAAAVINAIEWRRGSENYIFTGHSGKDSARAGREEGGIKK